MGIGMCVSAVHDIDQSLRAKVGGQRGGGGDRHAEGERVPPQARIRLEPQGEKERLDRTVKPQQHVEHGIALGGAQQWL